jgi:hypothetical protein
MIAFGLEICRNPEAATQPHRRPHPASRALCVVSKFEETLLCVLLRRLDSSEPLPLSDLSSHTHIMLHPSAL